MTDFNNDSNLYPAAWEAAKEILSGSGFYDKRKIEPWASEWRRLHREQRERERREREQQRPRVVYAVSLPTIYVYWGSDRYGR